MPTLSWLVSKSSWPNISQVANIFIRKHFFVLLHRFCGVRSVLHQFYAWDHSVARIRVNKALIEPNSSRNKWHKSDDATRCRAGKYIKPVLARMSYMSSCTCCVPIDTLQTKRKREYIAYEGNQANGQNLMLGDDGKKHKHTKRTAAPLRLYYIAPSTRHACRSLTKWARDTNVRWLHRIPNILFS